MARPGAAHVPRPRPLERVTLETSLKPFKRIDPASIRATCREAFRQWKPLCDIADRVAVMLWTGDGSEILEWRGELDDPLPWALSIGFCNEGARGLYPFPSAQPRHDYIDDLPAMTYATLRDIIATFKQVGRTEFGLDVMVGATVDPGPEFVESDFKYVRHRELFRGGPEAPFGPTVGFICAYARLQAEDRAYAGFPDGVPEGTSFGTFLGRQFRSFGQAMGFDYLWLSNGMGFSHYPWYYVGENFEGHRFGCVDYSEERERVLSFWRDLANEIPDVPLELRGTNYPMGLDIAAHCVSFPDIYDIGNIVNPPVNPPWGSRDLGMEVVAHLSRIAELPAGTYAVRHYLNDPWFYANPWWDYYNREPFDFYVLWVCSRVNGEGEVERSRFIELLTIDTEQGELNEDTALETIPHMRRAVSMAPDAPGLLTLVYPYREFHELARESPEEVGLAYFADLYLRSAVQNGLPLNTVISTDGLTKVLDSNPNALRDTILVALAPRADWDLSAQITQWVQSGGKAMLFGPLAEASDGLRGLLGVSLADPIDGELTAETTLAGDSFTAGEDPPAAFVHRSALSGGPITEVTENDSARAVAGAGARQRTVALVRAVAAWNGGAVAWARGSLPLSFRKGSVDPGGADNRTELDTSVWLRYLLGELGYQLVQRRHGAAARCIYAFVSRRDNAFIFTGHKPDGTASLLLRFPQGPPLLTERDARLQDGMAEYFLDRSYQHECRVFVDQASDALLTCKEQQHPTGTSRRLLVSGLSRATVTLYPSVAAVQAESVELSGPQDIEVRYDKGARCLTVAGVTGNLMVTW
jgi:hypothetical protein